MSQVVESVLVINPGYLSKRRAPGTYARLTVLPPSLNKPNTDGLIGHSLYERARVDIVRI
jgi:DNA polymerase alpha subunit B